MLKMSSFNSNLLMIFFLSLFIFFCYNKPIEGVYRKFYNNDQKCENEDSFYTAFFISKLDECRSPTPLNYSFKLKYYEKTKEVLAFEYDDKKCETKSVMNDSLGIADECLYFSLDNYEKLVVNTFEKPVHHFIESELYEDETCSGYQLGKFYFKVETCWMLLMTPSNNTFTSMVCKDDGSGDTVLKGFADEECKSEIESVDVPYNTCTDISSLSDDERKLYIITREKCSP